MGADIYADTNDRDQAINAGLLLSRLLNPHSEWDYDVTRNCFVERPKPALERLTQ